MADLLEQGATWLNQQRHEHLSRPVIYQRGEASVTLQATIGRTEHEVENGYGVLEKVETRDFIVRAEDLVLNGSAVLPKRGDRIIEPHGADGEAALTYEVMAPGTRSGSSHFKYADAYRHSLRIHTKHVGTESEDPVT